MDVLLSSIGIAGGAFGALWVWRDASTLRQRGASVSPVLWTTLTFFAWIVSLPGYLWLRKRVWMREDVVDLAEAPETFGGSSDQAEEAKTATNACGEETLRELVRELRGHDATEIWQRLQEHYRAHSCADVLDVGRFEEVVVSELARNRHQKR